MMIHWNSDDGFFQTMREIWNEITKLIGINNAPDFVQYTLYDNSRYIEVGVLGNTSFAKSYCLEDRIILVLHYVINDIPTASLLELREFNY